MNCLFQRNNPKGICVWCEGCLKDCSKLLEKCKDLRKAVSRRYVSNGFGEKWVKSMELILLETGHRKRRRSMISSRCTSSIEWQERYG